MTDFDPFDNLAFRALALGADHENLTREQAN